MPEQQRPLNMQVMPDPEMFPDQAISSAENHAHKPMTHTPGMELVPYSRGGALVPFSDTAAQKATSYPGAQASPEQILTVRRLPRTEYDADQAPDEPDSLLKRMVAKALLDALIARSESRAKDREAGRPATASRPVAPKWTKTQSTTTDFSRQSHETEPAPAPAPEPEPVAQRGLPGSPVQLRLEPPAPPESQPKAGEQQQGAESNGTYEFPNERYIHYQADEDGNVQLARVIDEPGSVLDLNRHRETRDVNARRFLVTDILNNQFFVTFGSEYDLDDMYATGEAIKGRNWFEVGSDQSPITIGERWQRSNGELTEYPIQSVVVASAIVNVKNESIARRLLSIPNQGDDPFTQHKNNIYRMYMDAQAAAKAARVRAAKAKLAAPPESQQGQKRGRWKRPVSPIDRKSMADAGHALLAEIRDTMSRPEPTLRGPRKRIVSPAARKAMADAWQALLAEVQDSAKAPELTAEAVNAKNDRKLRRQRAVRIINRGVRDAGKALAAELGDTARAEKPVAAEPDDEEDTPGQADPSGRRRSA